MAENEGYRSVACFLNEKGVIPSFRQFGTLNIQNLLYMQAELVQLEAELQCIAREDAQSDDPDRQNFRYSHLKLQKSLEEGDGDDIQWRKILEIREKLENYSMHNYLASSESFAPATDKRTFGQR